MTRSRPLFCDNGSLPTWSSSEPQHYLSYPSTSIPNISEMTHHSSHQSEQVHFWQDNAASTAYIQYLGNSSLLDGTVVQRCAQLGGHSLDTASDQECVACGLISPTMWRHDETGRYFCNMCRLCPRVEDSERSLPRLSRSLVRARACCTLCTVDEPCRAMTSFPDRRPWTVPIRFHSPNQRRKCCPHSSCKIPNEHTHRPRTPGR